MQTTPQLDKVLSRLDGVRTEGTGFMARCPAHEDNTPSLSINTNADGAVLLHCFAGCTPEAVLSACRLTFSDLYSDQDRTWMQEATLQRNVTYRASEPPSGPSPTAIYPYEDRDGSPLFRVVRFDHARGKRFRLERYERGAWLPKIDGVRRVLYRLPEVLRAIRERRRVYVVEGEKNADDLARRGLVATTNPNGAGKWTTYGDDYTETLRGADVVLLYDNDAPGRRHRDDVQRNLYGAAHSLRVIDLPGISNSEDVSDWFAQGGTAERLEGLADAAPEWSPQVETLRRASIVRASDVQPESVEWLWPLYLPRGKIVIADGDPGLAKSTVFLDLAARISTGGELPDGQRLAGPADVVLLSVEDGIADTIVPRLMAAGADRTRVHILQSVTDEQGERTPELPTDLPVLRALIERTGAAFVVIDPLMACLAREIDSHRDQDVRKAMTPLKRLAEETGATIVIIRHCSKGTGISAIHKGGGSVGLIGASRLGILFAKDPDAAGDSGRVIMAVTKSNLGPIPPALLYRTETDAAHGCGRVVWEGTTNHTADDLTGLPLDAGERSALTEALDFLTEMLRDTPMAVEELTKGAEGAGINQRTLRRAKGKLGVKSFRDGKGGRWLWGFDAARRHGETDTPPSTAQG